MKRRIRRRRQRKEGLRPWEEVTAMFNRNTGEQLTQGRVIQIAQRGLRTLKNAIEAMELNHDFRAVDGHRD